MSKIDLRKTHIAWTAYVHDGPLHFVGGMQVCNLHFPLVTAMLFQIA